MCQEIFLCNGLPGFYVFHLFSAGEIHEQDDCECNDGHDSCPQACGFVIAVLDDHGDLLGYGCGFS